MFINRNPQPSGTPWDLSAETILHYKCNDNAGNTVVIDDGTGSTNGISSTNTANLSVAGKIGQAFDFDSASNEEVNCNQTLTTTFDGPYSKALWLKPNDGQPAGTEIPLAAGNVGPPNDLTQLAYDAAGKVRYIYLSNGNTATALTNAAVFPNGATSWTHVVVNVSVTQIDIYINGALVALDGGSDGDMSGVTMGDMVLTENLYFGSYNDNGVRSSWYDGLADDLRIHTRILTQIEINGLYNNGIGTEALSGVI